ncbi:unnamed protein product [Candida verbasci]|uniref:Uncharacterized protein n=1 Tax=Candida verbasci TaxID=1227364 RepID=A0A9W4TWX6_9ASCO|nr:unnamed protein product [Candida verbasci]
MTSLAKLNAQYVQYIIKYPLLTKSITTGIFCGLNETISSILTGEYKESKILGINIKHVISKKLVKMIIYGSLIATPISHYLYYIINNKIFIAPLTSKQKVLQILTSLSTVTPILSACFVSWISLINNYTPGKEDLSTELKRIKNVVSTGLKKGYFSVLKTSLITSLFALIVAQRFVPPELWVVFFNLVYFIMGTYQNTKLKNLQKLNRK